MKNERCKRGSTRVFSPNLYTIANILIRISLESNAKLPKSYRVVLILDIHK